MESNSIWTGTLTAPGEISVPLLPFGPDGVWRSPLRQTCPDATTEDIARYKCCQSELSSWVQVNRRTIFGLIT